MHTLGNTTVVVCWTNSSGHKSIDSHRKRFYNSGHRIIISQIIGLIITYREY
jgi:hypothetical protein